MVKVRVEPTPDLAKHHPLVLLARRAVETFVAERRVIDSPVELEGELGERAGVFVCLKIGGTLRGCIGTFEPREENVATETIRNAVLAAMEDPRFPPVGRGELSRLEYTVDVLTAPEPVKTFAELDPKRFGVIVRSGFARGLLLPDLEGVDTVEAQVRIASAKAGIRPGEPVSLYRFEVRRYT